MAQNSPAEALVQPLDRLRSRLLSLKVHSTWREVARAFYPAVPAGTLASIAKGRDPKKPEIRRALGLPPILHLSAGPDLEIADGSVVLRPSRPCACGCGGSLIPNAWNHKYLPKHRKRPR